MAHMPDRDDLQAEFLSGSIAMNRIFTQVMEAQLGWDSDSGDQRRWMFDRPAMRQPYGTNGPLTSEYDADVVPYHDATELEQVRSLCRELWRENAFARSGHQNRENYIVGYGTTYTVTAKPESGLEDKSLAKAQAVIDEFIERNNWHTRQPEIVTRRDRDGECLLRKFKTDDGLTVRFVEPMSVFTPRDRYQQADIRYGVQFKPDDTETTLAYWVNGEAVEASEIQHRRRGDSLAVRGVPIFWTARRHLIAAVKILRNGSAITELQTAIGMIRKIAKAQASTIRSWAEQSANVKVTSNAPGYGTADSATTLHQRFEPGTIINANESIDYEFPAMGVDPSRYIDSLQAELRATAASVCMSESMFSAKTDDVNRASALVAEGPVTKNFERLQWDEAWWDKKLLGEELDYAVERGVISQSERDGVMITVGPPTLVPRDKLLDAQVRKLNLDAGILSKQTATGEAGYKYDEEQANIEADEDRNGGNVLTVSKLPPVKTDDDDKDEKDEA